jgi:hypothetical protein
MVYTLAAMTLMHNVYILLAFRRVNVLRTCLPHIFEGIGVPETMDRVLKLASSIAEIMDATCDYVPWDATTSAANVERVRRLHYAHAAIIAECELHLPASEFPIYLHETIHLCDTIMYWNSPRGYWCFLTERFVGYCKGFVKNRRFPVANVVNHSHYVYIM